MLKYNFSAEQISQNKQITIDPNCNGLTVINTGATQALVNQVPLNAGTPGTNNGESFSIGGNAGEVLAGRVDIVFPSGSGSVVVIQKYYLNFCQ